MKISRLFPAIRHFVSPDRVRPEDSARRILQRKQNNERVSTTTLNAFAERCSRFKPTGVDIHNGELQLTPIDSTGPDNAFMTVNEAGKHLDALLSVINEKSRKMGATAKDQFRDALLPHREYVDAITAKLAKQYFDNLVPGEPRSAQPQTVLDAISRLGYSPEIDALPAADRPFHQSRINAALMLRHRDHQNGGTSQTVSAASDVNPADAADNASPANASRAAKDAPPPAPQAATPADSPDSPPSSLAASRPPPHFLEILKTYVPELTRTVTPDTLTALESLFTTCFPVVAVDAADPTSYARLQPPGEPKNFSNIPQAEGAIAESRSWAKQAVSGQLARDLHGLLDTLADRTRDAASYLTSQFESNKAATAAEGRQRHVTAATLLGINPVAVAVTPAAISAGPDVDAPEVPVARPRTSLQKRGADEASTPVAAEVVQSARPVPVPRTSVTADAIRRNQAVDALPVKARVPLPKPKPQPATEAGRVAVEVPPVALMVAKRRVAGMAAMFEDRANKNGA